LHMLIFGLGVSRIVFVLAPQLVYRTLSSGLQRSSYLSTYVEMKTASVGSRNIED